MTDDELAQGLAVGTLDAEERLRAAHRVVEDRAFAARVEAWDMRLAPLALSVEPLTPPDVFAAIEARIAKAGIDLPGTITKRASEGEWTQVSPGLRIKVMHEMPELKRFTFMAQLEPGAEYVEHDHGQDEEIYMIEGDLRIGAVVLQAGDFHVAKAGKHHPLHRTQNGCVCLISQAIGSI